MVTVLFKTERVIKRRHRRDRIKTVTLCGAGKLLAFCGAYCPDMGDQRDFSLRLFGDNLQYLLSFSKALYKCFPGGTANVQPVDTLPDVKTHQTAQAFAIQLLLMIKWVNNAAITPCNAFAIPTSTDDEYINYLPLYLLYQIK